MHGDLGRRSCAPAIVCTGCIRLVGLGPDCGLHGCLHPGDLRVRQFAERRPPFAGKVTAVLES